MSSPKFEVMDVVRVRDTEWAREWGLAGREGDVTSIRAYPDGVFRYYVCSPTDEDVPGLYFERDLESTGRRGDLEPYRMSAPWRVRDIVRISEDYEDADVAGLLGHLDGEVSDYGGVDHLGVWIPSREIGYFVPIEFLVATGDRMPPAKLGRARSVIVDTAGNRVETTLYDVIDDIDQYV